MHGALEIAGAAHHCCIPGCVQGLLTVLAKAPAGWAHTDGGWLAHLSGSLENSGTPNQGRAPSRTAGKPAWAAARTTTTSMATITTTPPVATVSSCSRGGGSHVQQHRAAERWGLSGAPGVDVCQAKSNPDQDR